MLVHTNNMPDVSHLQPKAVIHFLVGTLAGRRSGQSMTEKRLFLILVRLIDKAISEYSLARYYVQAEESERKMTYEEILKRNQGQRIYTCPVINHLENCVTTLARIYKLRERHFGHATNGMIRNMRNSIEHIEDRIREAIEDSPVLNISNDNLVIQIAARNRGKNQMKTKDLADTIIELYKEIRTLL